MISGKLIWLIAVQFTIFKGHSCLNTSHKEIASVNVTLPVQTPSTTEGSTSNPIIGILTQNVMLTPNKTTTNQTRLEIIETFGEDPNKTTEETRVNATAMPNCLNITSVNLTCSDQLLNNTFKLNYTTVAEAVGVSNGFSAFKLQNTTAVAAMTFLVSAVIGYLSCIGYRRFLQRKYGNGQIIVGEEVYDTTDLRYFEI